MTQQSYLSLPVESLSDIAISALSKFEGTLCLDGLESISDFGASELAKHKGPELSLLSIEYLSEEATNALCAHNGRVSLGWPAKDAYQRARKRLGKK